MINNKKWLITLALAMCFYHTHAWASETTAPTEAPAKQARAAAQLMTPMSDEAAREAKDQQKTHSHTRSAAGETKNKQFEADQTALQQPEQQLVRKLLEGKTPEAASNAQDLKAKLMAVNVKLDDEAALIGRLAASGKYNEFSLDEIWNASFLSDLAGKTMNLATFVERLDGSVRQKNYTGDKSARQLILLLPEAAARTYTDTMKNFISILLPEAEAKQAQAYWDAAFKGKPLIA